MCLCGRSLGAPAFPTAYQLTSLPPCRPHNPNPQFLAWDTFARRRIDLVGRTDDGDQVIAHEFDFLVENQARSRG
jgi:hypothetical protein